MTNLNDIINQKAKEYGDTGSFQEWLRLPENKSLGFIEGEYSKTIRCFTAGASFATTDPLILQAILQPFAEWIRTFEALERQNGQWVIESQLSDEQIVKAFIADNKQKEDGK